MVQSEINQAESEIAAVVYKNRWSFIALGTALVLLGAAALAFPLVSTIAMKTLLGWIFLFGGIGQIVQAFYARGWGLFFLNVLVGLLYAMAGAWLALIPIAGLLSLTIFVGILVSLSGLMEVAMGWQMRPEPGWGWFMTSGLLALIIGGGILSGLPGTAAWIIGALAGVNLLSSGAAFLAIGAGAKGVLDRLETNDKKIG